LDNSQQIEVTQIAYVALKLSSHAVFSCLHLFSQQQDLGITFDTVRLEAFKIVP